MGSHIRRYCRNQRLFLIAQPNSIFVKRSDSVAMSTFVLTNVSRLYLFGIVEKQSFDHVEDWYSNPFWQHYIQFERHLKGYLPILGYLGDLLLPSSSGLPFACSASPLLGLCQWDFSASISVCSAYKWQGLFNSSFLMILAALSPPVACSQFSNVLAHAFIGSSFQ